jgi:hypothetical protein
MKIIKQLLFLIACISMLMACTKSDVFIPDETQSTTLKTDTDATTLKKGKRDPVMVSVPLKTHFTVWNHTDPTDSSCGEMPILKITMIGEGIISHLGRINTTMTFCNDISTGDYWETDVVFIAANGDELYASIPVGKVIDNDEENSNYYNKRFNDEMFFTGGTGRFKGASGMAMTNAYVHLPTDEYRHEGDEIWHTDFFSTGTLILIKGKGKN